MSAGQKDAQHGGIRAADNAGINIDVAIDGMEVAKRQSRNSRAILTKCVDGNGCLKSKDKQVYSMEEIIRMSIGEQTYEQCLGVLKGYRVDAAFHDGGRTVGRLRSFYGISGDGHGQRNDVDFASVFCRLPTGSNAIAKRIVSSRKSLSSGDGENEFKTVD